jgi:hypothetical protein
MATVKEKGITTDNVFMVVRDEVTGQVMGFTHGHNIVTRAGRDHVARLFQDGTQVLTLMSQAQIHVATLVITPPTVSANRSWYTVALSGVRSMDSGWPMINGGDSGNNPGTFATWITTFKTTFAAAQAIGTIKGVAVAPPQSAATSSRPVFNFFTLSRAQYRQKTALDLLSVYCGIAFLNP